jgi:hypothetical protein
MKNLRPLLIVVLILLFFVGFVVVITCESEGSKAKKELAAVTSYSKIKPIWDKFPKIRGKTDWEKTVEQKILSLKLSDAQKQDIESWYPVRSHLNITIVPDLSNRLELPDQPKFDVDIINHIWKSFQQSIPSRYHYGELMHDRFAIDISDREAAQGKFKVLANELIFDLSSLGTMSPIVHLRNEEPKFHSNIQQLYRFGASGLRGADYRDFFDSRAKSNIIKSTLFDRYRNIAILITDGYLEISYGPHYSKTSPPTVNPLTNLSGLEVLMLENHERKGGKGDFQNNRDMWYKWLSAMGAKVDYDNFFQAHNDASGKTKLIIDEFLQGNEQVMDIPLTRKSEKMKDDHRNFSSEKPSSKADQIANYIAIGDAKCKAFKEANSPHLYHIANDYYNYAAELANSTPKVCE